LVAHRRSSAAVLALGAWILLIGAQPAMAASHATAAIPLVAAADTPAHRNGVLGSGGPSGAAVVVGERGERVSEAAAHDRRLTSRDGRPVDWIMPASLVGVAAAALASTLARRRHRRLTARSPRFAPARGPPRLIPS
jgi:hypothetical protein